MKSPFEFWNRNFFLEYIEDDVRIYSGEMEKFLFIGDIMYASTSERGWYIRYLYPHAKGKCLEIGLGLGVASKVMLATHQVDHLLTIEKNERVIKAFGKPLHCHSILQTDANEWASKLVVLDPVYDLIFVDHYSNTDEETYPEVKSLVDNLKPLVKKNGKLIVWIDSYAQKQDQEAFADLWTGTEYSVPKEAL